MKDALATAMQACTKRDERPDFVLTETPAQSAQPETLAPQGAADISRVVAALLVKGETPVDIAKVLGREEAQIRAIIRNPLTLEYIREVTNDDQYEAATNILEGSLVDTVIELIRLRDNPNTPIPVKLNVCREILDRAQGKVLPENKRQQNGKNKGVTAIKDADELDKEIERLKKQLEHQG